MNTSRGYLAALNVQEKLEKTSSRLDKLSTGALVAATAGAIVLGIVGGGILWMPAAMSGALVLYRGAGHYFVERHNIRNELWWKEYHKTLQAKKDLHSGNFSVEEVQALSAPLERKLDQLSKGIRSQGTLQLQDHTSTEANSDRPETNPERGSW